MIVVIYSLFSILRKRHMVKKKLAQMATSGVVKIIVEDNLHRLRTRETKIIHNFEEKRNDELKKIIVKWKYEGH